MKKEYVADDNIKQINDNLIEMLSSVDDLISSAIGIASGPQGYSIFIETRERFREKIVALFEP